MSEQKQQTNLGQLIHDHCYIAQKSRKTLAAEIDITESELQGMAAGRVPAGSVLIKLINWLAKETTT